MRISVRESDPGFSANAIGSRVFVDGVEIGQCFTADEEEGVAYCFAVGDDGQPFIDPDNPDKCKEIEIRGDVKIVLPDGP